MKVYVSGPITGWADARQRFNAGAEVVREDGDDPLNPFNVSPCADESCQNTPGFPRSDGHAWGCWLKHDLAAMLNCDGVATLPGWESSRGAVLEVQTALAVAMPVRHIEGVILDRMIKRIEDAKLPPTPPCSICSRVRLSDGTWVKDDTLAMPAGFFAGGDGNVCPECMVVLTGHGRLP